MAACSQYLRLVRLLEKAVNTAGAHMPRELESEIRSEVRHYRAQDALGVDPICDV